MLSVEWDLFSIYLYTVKKLDRNNESTDRSRFNNIKRYFSVSSYDETNVHAFFSYLECERKLKPSSLNNYLKLMKHLNRYMKIEPDFLRDFSMFRAVLPEIEVLTQSEKDRIIQEAYKREYRYGVLFETIYKLALRVSEACDLTWNDFKGNVMIIRDPKAGHPQRMPILPSLSAKIDKIERVSVHIFGPKKLGKEQKGRVHKDTVSRILKDCAREAGIMKRVHPHLLRHTSIDQFARVNNKNSFLTKSFARHKRIETTTRYIHLEEDEVRSAVEHMEPELMAFDSLKSKYLEVYETTRQSPHMVTINQSENIICIVARRANYTPLDIFLKNSYTEPDIELRSATTEHAKRKKSR